jgi:WhiB family transcriptional regulator, redox-sensing transcriptional regulator
VNLIMETLSSVGPDQAVEPVSMDLLREPLVAAETFGAETFEPGSFGAATFGTDSFGSESFTAGTLGGDAAEEPGWQEQALCAQTDPEAFFPEKGGSTREAKRICSGCEVRAECLEYALANDERFGIWGGLSERERRRIRRQRAQAARSVLGA